MGIAQNRTSPTTLRCQHATAMEQDTHGRPLARRCTTSFKSNSSQPNLHTRKPLPRVLCKMATPWLLVSQCTMRQCRCREALRTATHLLPLATLVELPLAAVTRWHLHQQTSTLTTTQQHRRWSQRVVEAARCNNKTTFSFSHFSHPTPFK